MSQTPQQVMVAPEVKPANGSTSDVSTAGIIILAGYQIILSLLLIYGLMAFWPLPPTTGSTPVAASPVRFLFWDFPLAAEVRMLMIVVIAGALGGLIHALRSLIWYVGNRGMKRSWILMYIVTPLIGSILSVIFYLVLRSGLFASQGTVADTNPFGFAAISGLVGMFSNLAAVKLKEVAESLFSPKESTAGADHISPEQAAKETEAKPAASINGGKGQTGAASAPPSVEEVPAGNGKESKA